MLELDHRSPIVNASGPPARVIRCLGSSSTCMRGTGNEWRDGPKSHCGPASSDGMRHNSDQVLQLDKKTTGLLSYCGGVWIHGGEYGRSQMPFKARRIGYRVCEYDAYGENTMFTMPAYISTMVSGNRARGGGVCVRGAVEEGLHDDGDVEAECAARAEEVTVA